MKLKYIILLLTSFLLTGCDNYHELNDLGIVTAIGIDKTETGYKVTTQIINTQKADSTNLEFSNFITLEGYGETVKQAVDEINKESSKYLYLSHLNLLLIDENIAKDGILDVLDVFIREPVSRTDFYILLAKDYSSSDILKVFTALNSIPSIKIVNTIKEDTLSNSNTFDLTFLDLLINISKKEYDISIPSISIVGNLETGQTEDNLKEALLDARLVLTDIAIFKDDILTDYITNEETIYYNMIQDNFNQGTISYQCKDNNYMTIKIDQASSKIKPTYENNQLQTNINVEGEISIYENNCLYEDNEDVYKIVENDLNIQINTSLTNLINKTQELNTDIFGIGNNLYLNNYKTYKTIQSWDSLYKENNVTIETNFILNKKGNDEENIIGELIEDK